MALIDLEAREIHAKIVYFGPELSGTTTTLRAIAEGVNRLAGDPELAARFGRAGRERAVTSFAWDAIAQQTVDLYASLR